MVHRSPRKSCDPTTSPQEVRICMLGTQRQQHKRQMFSLALFYDRISVQLGGQGWGAGEGLPVRSRQCSVEKW